MTTYLTETFTGTNGANWNTSNWGTEASTTGASTTIQSNKGQINAGSLTGYSGRRSMKALISNVADVEFLGTFQHTGSVDYNTEIWLRAITGTFDSRTGYFVFIDAGNNVWKLYKAVNYTYTQIGSDHAVTWSNGVDYGLRFQVIGTTLKVRLWTGTEPGTWDATHTDSSVAAANGVVIHLAGGSAANGTMLWDNIQITNGAGNAFTYTGSCQPSGTYFKTLVTKNPFTGSITAAGVFTKIKVVVKVVTGSITATGAFAKQTQKRLSGTITPTGLYLKRLTKILTGSITGTGAFRKASARTFTGTVATTGALATTPLGRIFGRPGIVVVSAIRAAEAFIRIRRT